MGDEHHDEARVARVLNVTVNARRGERVGPREREGEIGPQRGVGDEPQRNPNGEDQHQRDGGLSRPGEEAAIEAVLGAVTQEPGG